jgi:hypothetical protein
MTQNGHFVFDCVTHAFDNRLAEAASDYARRLMEHNYRFQWQLIPDPYRIPEDRYFQATDADTLASALFVESGTDVACFHSFPAWGIYKDYSPMRIGREIRERWPGRMLVYGAISPLEGKKAIEDLERQHEEWKISGLKLYPVDVIDGEMRSYSMGDEQLLYPVFERCRELGIPIVAIHKALPLGTAPMDPFKPSDVDYAAADFPDLKFEIVHGGYAFLEETAAQVSRFDNVYINLEVTSQLVVKHPMQFARIIGELMLWGGAKKTFWGTGCSFTHPRPVLEAFENFQMPRELVEGYGYPELTDEIKADILGLNFARFHELDVDKLTAAIADDELARRRVAGDVEPWSRLGKAGSAVAA